MFINGILTNAEVWHNVKKAEIEEFEQLDRSLLRQILKVPISTPKESFYLELGILPIGTVVKARRIIYLHDLVNQNHTEMLHQFFITQWNKPTRGDWTELVKEDLNDFGIDEDLVMLQQMSKGKIKKLIKAEARKYAFNELKKSIEGKKGHSKLKNIRYTELKMQDYLMNGNIKKEEAINIFKFRTHMADFGENFKSGADVVICPLCLDHIDSQSNSFKCQIIKNKIEVKGNMKDVYGSNIPRNLIQTIQDITKVRNDIFNNEE